MSRIFLVRHGERSGDKNVLIGRSAGYPLTLRGETQARALSSWAAAQRITRVYTSPRERCVQTARFLSGANGEQPGVAIEVSPALDEFDFGNWTGRTIASLEGDEHWRRFNIARAQVGASGGESMQDVQRRVVEEIIYRSADHAPWDIVAVTHAEPIRAALLYFMGRSLDDWADLEIAEASVSTVEYTEGQYKVAQINVCEPGKRNNSPGSAGILARRPLA